MLDNAAYDRHWAGRTIFGNLFAHVRNLGRLFAVTVDRPNTAKNVLGMYGAMNLLCAFVVSIKHMLRNETGHHYEDLYHLLIHLPDWVPGSSHPETPNLPLEIAMHIAGYIDLCKKSQWIDIPTGGAMQNILMGMMQCLSDLERIGSSPIPKAYLIHLKQITFLYLLSLPFQLIKEMGWTTIPVVCLSSFIFFGIEAIGNEIEQPFGYDKNHLALDKLCKAMRQELNYMINRASSISPDEWTDPVDLADLNFYVVIADN